MNYNILITYASKYGSTGEIAEKIGEVLSGKDLTTHVKAADEVTDISTYDGVVLGSAVYIGKWRKQALNFLTRFERELMDMDVWIFSSGPTGVGDPGELLNDWTIPSAIQSLIDDIEPKDITVFHGSIDRSKLNLLERSAIRMVKAPTGDFRDWEAIKSWAEKIAESLTGEPA